MSRIVIDARELRSSTGRYISKLIENLQKIDDKNGYSILLKPDDFAFWAPKVSNFEKVLCKYEEFTFNEQTGFKKQLESLKPDLVHFGMVQQPVFYKDNKVTTMHDLTTCRFRNPSKNVIIFTLKQWIYKWVNKKVAKDSDAVITPSNFVKNDVINFAKVDEDKFFVTYEAADKIETESEEISSLKDKKFIMYVGRSLPHKNLERLLEAFKLVLKNNPDLSLVLAGKKDVLYEKLEDMSKELGLENNVFFAGFVSEGQLKWLYEHTKAYVFPSLSEGFGLPGLEAMAHGAPVVSSNATCLPEIYGDAAIYFDPKDTQDMANAIEHVILNDNVSKELVEKGKKQVTKYSWERCAKQTLDVYNKILNLEG